MKIGIMQPYFFPYIGYISLIKHTDRFILFDPVQFIRHGWIERNRILKQNDGWLYIQVPLSNKGRDVIIKDLVIDNSQNWKGKLLAQLQPYKKIAPNYFKVMKLINEVLGRDYNFLVDLNLAILQHICDYLSIEHNISVFSEMDLQIDTPEAPDEWALNICKALGNIDEYWNPPGGQSFFDKSKYDAAGINLKFQSVNLKPYSQSRENFETGLSIIDLLMFNSIEEIHGMLDDYTLI